MNSFHAQLKGMLPEQTHQQFVETIMPILPKDMAGPSVYFLHDLQPDFREEMAPEVFKLPPAHHEYFGKPR